MTTDQLNGQWLQFKCDLKQTWGNFTDNDVEEIGDSYEFKPSFSFDEFFECNVDLMREIGAALRDPPFVVVWRRGGAASNELPCNMATGTAVG